MAKASSLMVVLVVSVFLMFSACISHFSVTKVVPGTNPKGLRVHLPAPFIVGRPAPDGTIKYGVEYLPDPDEEYAITAWSVMAKQKTDIARTVEMYVQKMNLSQDTTAVAAQLAASAGAVGKSAVDNMVAQKQAETAANTAAAKARTDAIRAREGDILLKEAALEKANVDLQVAEEALAQAKVNGADPATLKALSDKVVVAKSGVAKAEIDLNAAKEALAAAKNFDRPSPDKNTDAPKETIRSVPGPVAYRIVENPQTGGIALERVNFKLFSLTKGSTRIINSGSQLDFETWGKKPASDTSGNPEGAKPKLPKMTSPANGRITLDKFQGVLSQTLQFDTEVKEQMGDPTMVDAQQNDQKKYLKKVAISGKSVTLTWGEDIPSGTYVVNLPLWFKDGRANRAVITVDVK